jgi:rSAM/selenodomain-associated transferase 1
VLQIGIFAKYWEPGKVKTRLAAAVGQVEAARLYRHFVQTLVERFGNVAQRRVLAYSPRERSGSFTEIVGKQWALEPQSEGDLGQRMASYFENGLKAGATRVVLIGSDSPTLPQGVFDRAFHALESADVVLGPTDDGGYYLVGASQSVPAIFDNVEWSSSHVFEQTVEKLSAANLTWAALPTSYDIDDLDDLVRLQDELSDYRGPEEALIRLRRPVDQVLRKVNRHA